MLRQLVLGAMVVGAALFGSATAPQAANVVLNGDFTLTSLSSPGGYLCATSGTTCSSNLTDWDGTCSSSSCNGSSTPSSLLFPGTGGSAFNGDRGLWTYNESPLGKSANVVAIDGDPQYNASISQTISGLVAGHTYELTFYQSSGQQTDLNGATTEWWAVSIGSDNFTSTVMNTPEHGAVDWAPQSFSFVASSTSELLTFLAHGTPGGEPPVALLTGVDIEASSVPEPGTWAMMLVGLLAVGGLSSVRRRRLQAA